MNRDKLPTSICWAHPNKPEHAFFAAFHDIAKAIQSALFELDCYVAIVDLLAAPEEFKDKAGDRPLILGANIVAHEPDIEQRITEAAIIYNMEQLAIAPAIPDAYLRILKRASTVWDYSTMNIDYLRRQHGVHSQYVPLGWCPFYGDITRKKEFTAPFVFYGNATDRRMHLCGYIGYCGHTVNFMQNVFSKKRNDVISESRCVLTLGHAQQPMFDAVRHIEAWSSGIPVISEMPINWCDLPHEIKHYSNSVIYQTMHQWCNRYATDKGMQRAYESAAKEARLWIREAYRMQDHIEAVS